jgi:hypothetical protein
MLPFSLGVTRAVIAPVVISMSTEEQLLAQLCSDSCANAVAVKASKDNRSSTL